MQRFRSCAVVLCLFSVSTFLTSCEKEDQPKAAADTRAADEAVIRAADVECVKMIQSKDVDRWLAFFSDNASIMLPSAPAVVGKDALRKTMAGFVATPGFALTLAPTKIEVSKSGDIAYEVGNSSLTVNDAKGKPQTTNAMYVTVWAKQTDGTWKVVLDVPTTTTQ